MTVEPTKAFTFSTQFADLDKKVKVSGYSNVRVLQLGSLNKKQTSLSLVALSVIAILVAVVFSYVPGLSGFSSIVCGGVLLGVLLVTVVPAVKRYLFKQDVKKYLKGHAEEVRNLFEGAKGGMLGGGWTLDDKHTKSLSDLPPSIKHKVICYKEAENYRLELHENDGALKLRCLQFWSAARGALGE